MVDQWRIECGPDDSYVIVTKNGEVVGRFQVYGENLGHAYAAFKWAMGYVEQHATVTDELVIHCSGTI